jgi:hypothetical protein
LAFFDLVLLRSVYTFPSKPTQPCMQDQVASSNSSWRSRGDGAIGALEMAG